MELFERVKAIAQNTPGGQAAMGQKIGLNPRTFQGYLTRERQDNLWPLLPKILAAYPEISRDWLYFCEGRYLSASDDQDNMVEQKRLDELAELRQQVINLQEKLSLQDKLIATQELALETKNEVVRAKEEALKLYQKFYTAEAPIPQKPAGAAASLTGVARSTPKRTKDTP